MNIFRKLASAFLVALTLLCLIPASAFASGQYVNMSDEFRSVLTNDKLILHSAKPSSKDEQLLYTALDSFLFANPDFSINPDTFTEDFSVVELVRRGDPDEKFFIEVVWDYDAHIQKEIPSVMKNFPKEWENYISLELTDLEFINYLVYHTPGIKSGALANYSSQLKAVFQNTNFYFEVQTFGGGKDPFFTTNGGVASLVHNGSIYKTLGGINTQANHVIYVPEKTADTKEALMAAAQKKVDDYIGKNVIKITHSGTVADFYQSELALYQAALADAIAQLDQVRARLAQEEGKEEALRDPNLIAYYQSDIANCQRILQQIAAQEQKEKPECIDLNAENTITDTASGIGNAYNNKVGFLESYAEGGAYHFLNNAAGGYVFNVDLLQKNQSYKFIVVKDDTKQTVPAYASTDFKTDASVSADSSQMPLDTVIKVEKITHGAEHERICGILEIQDGEIFDIKLYSGSLDDYISQIQNGKFKVRLPVKNEYKNKQLVVYYVDAKGNTTKYAVTVKNNYAFFETDHFSIYTLAVEPPVTPPTSAAPTGVSSGLTSSGTAASLSSAGSVSASATATGAALTTTPATGHSLSSAVPTNSVSGPTTGVSSTSPAPAGNSSLVLWLTVPVLLLGGLAAVFYLRTKKAK